MQHLTKKFQAKDENGKSHWLFVYTQSEIIQAALERIQISGNTTLRTENGQIADTIEKGKYKILATGRMLFSDSPDAE